MKNKSNLFKYIVIFAVILIPFMYSFFYLKAYWNPYGKGNMDNIDVAIVNNDEGNKGKEFAEKLVNSKKLGFNIVSEKDANDGLYNKDYYAVINIPKDFTKNLESAKDTNKTPATVTYSPNQKTNYLASQIISRVLVVAEEQTRDKVSKEVVNTLSNKLNEIPNKMEALSDGSNKLNEGSSELSNGLSLLNDKYSEFDNGVNKVNVGSNTLSEGLNSINAGSKDITNGAASLNSGISQINKAVNNVDFSKLNDLSNGVNAINNGINSENGLKNGVNSYVNGTENLAGGVLAFKAELNNQINSNNNIIKELENKVETGKITKEEEGKLYNLKVTNATLNNILNNNDFNKLTAGANVFVSKDSSTNLTKGKMLSLGMEKVATGSESLAQGTKSLSSLAGSMDVLKASLNKLDNGSSKLLEGTKQLNNGTSKAYSGSVELSNGSKTLVNGSSLIKESINKASIGSKKLSDGTSLLNSSVNTSINSSKEELKKLDGLGDFVEKSMTIEEEDVNGIDSYGVAFGPFFMSIALWVGSLMAFIVLYYDANDRFELFSRNAKNKLKRTLCYLALASIQGIVLGILLMIGLDLNITNYFLYFVSLILVGCFFEAIMEFLICNFGDIGKFIALILLVLQLAAAGGTFPIQTVTKGFRFLNPVLPMKYTCDLFKETIISIEKGLLTKSLVVIIISFIVLLTINIIKDLYSKNN